MIVVVVVLVLVLVVVIISTSHEVPEMNSMASLEERWVGQWGVNMYICMVSL